MCRKFRIMEIKKCPECGSKELVRKKNGELVCKVCGLVIEEGFMSGNTLL